MWSQPAQATARLGLTGCSCLAPRPRALGASAVERRETSLFPWGNNLIHLAQSRAQRVVGRTTRDSRLVATKDGHWSVSQHGKERHQSRELSATGSVVCWSCRLGFGWLFFEWFLNGRHEAGSCSAMWMHRHGVPKLDRDLNVASVGPLNGWELGLPHVPRSEAFRGMTRFKL